MSRAQNSGTSTPSTSNNSQPPKANLSHPCFDCGLMFANKDDYQHHESVFHNVREKTTFMLCDECGKTFESVDDLGEHQLEHDLSILVRALYETEAAEAINRAQFVTTKSNKYVKMKKSKKQINAAQMIPHVDVSDSDVASKQNSEMSYKRSVDVVPKPTKKLKKERFFNVPNERGSEGPSPKKIKKQMNLKEPSSTKEASKILSHLISFNDRATSTDPPSQIVPAHVAPTPSLQAQTVTAPTNQPPVPLHSPQNQTVANAGSASSAPVLLSSICPNCNENHGKPWSLIEHMIAKHGALLVRLEKKFTTENNHSVSEFFTNLRCQYCSMDCDQLPTCLSHIVRTHREKLFECSTFGECEVCFELMSSFGVETFKRKFTIRVKIKRRAASRPV